MSIFVSGVASTYAGFSQPEGNKELDQRIKDICLEPVSIDVDKMVKSVMGDKEKAANVATAPSLSQDLFPENPTRIQRSQDPFFNTGEDEMTEFDRSLLG